MNELNEVTENPIKLIFDLYNEFRLCAGLERDNLPAENVWLDSNGKPFFLKEPEDEAAVMDITALTRIEMKFFFDECDTDEVIKAKISELQNEALNHKARHWTSLNWLTDINGRKRNWPKITKILLDSLTAYKAGKPYSVIVAALNLADSNAKESELKYADKKAKRYHMHAEELIEAAKIDFSSFCNTAMKALPRNL